MSNCWFLSFVGWLVAIESVDVGTIEVLFVGGID